MAKTRLREPGQREQGRGVTQPSTRHFAAGYSTFLIGMWCSGYEKNYFTHLYPDFEGARARRLRERQDDCEARGRGQEDHRLVHGWIE